MGHFLKYMSKLEIMSTCNKFSLQSLYVGAFSFHHLINEFEPLTA